MSSDKKCLPIKEIRITARDKMLDGLGRLALLTLMYFLLSTALLTCQSFYALENSNVLSIIISVIVTFLFAALSGLAKYGFASYFLKFTNGIRVGVSEVFAGFTQSPDRTIFVTMFLVMIKFICLIPYAVCSVMFSDTFGSYALLARVGIYTACMVAYYVFTLRYAPVYFLLNDLPDKRGTEILMLSKWLMKKNKRRLFALQVSFIPMFILTILSCFVGALWTIPYYTLAECYFYQDISSSKSA